MSTITKRQEQPTLSPDQDPFRYGWREMSRRRADGTYELVQTPLTLEDLLHPEEGDVHVENSIHSRNRRYLADVLESLFANDRGVVVLCDCRVGWDDPELTHHSPDITVVFGVRNRKDYYSNFDVVAEGARPTVLIELVSPHTRLNDVDTKVDHYHRLRVPHYVIVDHERVEGPLSLIGYRYDPRAWKRMPLDEQGRLWIEPLKLWLAVFEDRLVCLDATLARIPDYREAMEARQAAQNRAETEKARADSAEARIRELEAELSGRPKRPRKKSS